MRGREREGKISKALTSDNLYWKDGRFGIESVSWKAISVSLYHNLLYMRFLMGFL